MKTLTVWLLILAFWMVETYFLLFVFKLNPGAAIVLNLFAGIFVGRMARGRLTTFWD